MCGEEGREKPVKFIFKDFFLCFLFFCLHNWHTIGPIIIILYQKTPNVPINVHGYPILSRSIGYEEGGKYQQTTNCVDNPYYNE